MKNDQYIPHEVSARNNSQVINLVEAEGAAGYGFYWAVLEYLRVQNHYTGDIRAIRTIARQLKVRLNKALRILNDYGLFVVEGIAFHSPLLDEKMKSFDRRRAQCEAYKRQKELEHERKSVANVSEVSCNSLTISDTPSTIINKQPLKQEQPLKQQHQQQQPSMAEDEGDGGGDDAIVPEPPVVLAWERYVDSLAQEQSWIEIMAMRSGLGVLFVKRFPEVLQRFKHHVQAVGNEKDIQSPSDAKRYFCFFNTPGSATFRKLVEELHKPVDKGKYKYEDRDPTTGQRSYCGVPIPGNAPPRPNEQAVWCEGEWRY